MAKEELIIRVNGVLPAFMEEMGCSCKRCSELRQNPYKLANTSYSLILMEDKKMWLHVLVDVGLGVVNSLLDAGLDKVNMLILSHSHFDHVAQLDWLANSLKRNECPDQPRPLPVYCTQECWEDGPKRLFPYLVGKAVKHYPIFPGTTLHIGPITITPLAVDHGDTAPGAVMLIIEWDERDKKVILSGDLLRVPNPYDPLLFGADVLFLEANTWNRHPETSHISFLEGLELIKLWHPKRTYLIHYSGYEDKIDKDAEVKEPLTDDSLIKKVREFFAKRGIIQPHNKKVARTKDSEIKVAYHGLELTWETRRLTEKGKINN